MIALQATAIDERTTPQDLERIRRNIVDALRELQQQPFVIARPVTGISLEDGKVTSVPHGLGRKALVFLSPPRGATAIGRILEVRDGGPDPSKYFTLQAFGWGATITVDALVL
jgi:hypothetical protein